MKVTVENPTTTAKAVRAAGGLPVIFPGDRIVVNVDWSDAEHERYAAAGLVISEVKPGRSKSKLD